MKNLLFGFIATVLFSSNSISQITKENLEKTYGLLTLVDVPLELITTQKSPSEQVIPIINKNGTLLIVCNEGGLKSIFMTQGTKLKTDYKQKLNLLNSSANNLNARISFCKWLINLFDPCFFLPCNN